MNEYKIQNRYKTPHIIMSQRRNDKNITEEIIRLNLLQIQRKK